MTGFTGRLQKNLNDIDLLLTLGYDFKTAVSILVRMYDEHRSLLPCAESPLASSYAHSSSPDQQRRIPLLQLAQQFGIPGTYGQDSVQGLFGNKCDQNYDGDI